MSRASHFPIGRRAFLVGTTVAVLLSGSSTAVAHIDPDPTEAQAGSRLSIGFTVEHGCDGSPTTALDMRLPDGVTDPVPEPPDGWEGSVTDNVVTFTGGPLPDDQELAFNVAMTVPPTPDATIYFPFVQRCEVGEIRWIDLPSEGSGGELDEPAPAMQLVGPVATTTTPPTAPVAPITTAAATTTTTTPPPRTTSPPTTETTTETTAETSAPGTATRSTEPSASVPPDTVSDVGDDDLDGGAPVAVTIAIVATLAAAAVGVVVYVRRRKP